MLDILNLIGLGIVAFISTNIDDFFITTTFFIDNKYPIKKILIGKYIGILLLITISCLGYFFKLIISIRWIGIMGIIPIIIGSRHIISIVKSKKQTENIKTYQEVQEAVFIEDKTQQTGIIDTKTNSEKSGILFVTLITFSNGGDNIGVYMPLFASLGIYELALIIIIFLIMVSIWSAIAYYFVNNKYIGFILKKYGEPCFPFVLILLGIYIFIKCKTFTL